MVDALPDSDNLKRRHEFDALWAKIPPKRRKQLEKIRDEERARYERLHREAREEWERNPHAAEGREPFWVRLRKRFCRPI